MEFHVDIIGYLAACLTTFSFLVQAVKSWRTKDLSGISVGMYSMFASGVALWLAYGLVTLAFALSILIMKIREVHK